MNSDNSGSQGITTAEKHQSSTPTKPPEYTPNDSLSESQKIKELCKSLGLLESVYSSNSDMYYPVLTPDENDIDYINFKDIINKS